MFKFKVKLVGHHFFFMIQEETFRYAYIVSNEKDKGLITDKVKRIAPQLLCTMISQTIEKKSYTFLAFQKEVEKKIILEQIQTLQIPENQFFPIFSQDTNQDFSKPLYITNIPPNFDEFLNEVSDIAPTETFNGLVKKMTIMDKNAGQFMSICLPQIEFSGGIHLNITSDPLSVPVITVSNLPPDFRIKELPLFKCPFKILRAEAKNDSEENCPKTVYLLFSTNKEAFQAVEYFNFAKIDQYDIEAIHFHDKAMKTIKAWEITIRKISTESRPFDVWDRFKQYGQIIQTKVLENPKTGLIYATVQFFHKTDAENAINDVRSSGSSLLLGFTNDFIVTMYNIDPSLKSQDIIQYFQKVSNVEINQFSSGSTNSATITFHTPNSAESCFTNEIVINGLLACPQKGPYSSQQKNTVKALFKQYLSTNTIKINLPKTIGLQDIITACSKFGVCRYVEVKSKQSIVSFVNQEMAHAASKEFLEKGINGLEVTVENIF